MNVLFLKLKLSLLPIFFILFLFSVHSASADIATGLVSHYKMDETSGTTAVDSTGTNTGTITGATFSAGKINNGLSFNGTSDYAKLSNILPAFSEFTVSSWVKVDDLAAVRGIFTSRNGSNNSFRYRIDTTGFVRLIIGGASTVDASTIMTSGALQVGKFYHIVVSGKSAEYLRIYVDGVLVREKTTTQAIGVPNAVGYIGSSWNTSTELMKGIIDDVRLYNRALSAADVTELYNYTGASGSSSSSSSVQPPPTATTNSATSITSTSATLNATVNNNGLTTLAWFQYGLTTAFGNTTPTQTVSSLGNIALNSSVSSLSPSTVYYYRIAAQSSAGTTYGSVQTFTTAVSTSGKTYYIDPAGNDTNNGLSESTPWKTISKVYLRTFLPGDTLLFKRGGVWKEGITMYLNGVGTINNPIVMSAYGVGNKPVISSILPITGWNISGNWSVYSGNIWKMTYPRDPNRLWLNNSEVLRASILADVGWVNRQGTLEQWFYDAASTTLYLYATSNPAIQYSSIEGGNQGSPVFSIKNGAEYLTIDGIDFRGGSDFTTVFFGAASHITLKNSNIGYGRVGLAVTSSDSALTANNIIIENNTFDSGFNFFWGASSDKTTGEGRGSEDGILLYDAVNNSIIRNNTFTGWGHTAVYIRALDSTKDGSHDNKIHNNTFNGSNASYGRPISTDGLEGKSYDNEFYNNLFKNHSTRSQINGNNNWVHHNIFDGQTNSPVKAEGMAWGVGEAINLSVYGTNWVSHDNKIDNNLFMNTAEPAVLLRSNGFANKVTNNYIRNNIFYNTGTNPINTWSKNNPGTAIAMEKTTEEFNNVFQNNCVFNPGKPVTNAVNYYGAFLSMAQFNLKNGTNGNTIGNNIQMDPMFVDYLNKNYHLQLTSPCIDAGIAIAGLTNDFDGNPIYVGAGPDIGAYEDPIAQSADTTKPTGSISINSNVATTNSVKVTLNLSATDAIGVTGYFVSENSTAPTASQTGWTAITSATTYSANLIFTLSSSDGTKIVYVWYKDAAGNVSTVYNDSITLAKNDSWKNHYIVWRDASSANAVKYAKQMGYDYINALGWRWDEYKNNPDAAGMKYYDAGPHLHDQIYDTIPGYSTLTVLANIKTTYSYTQEQKDWYNKYMIWKSNDAWPNNLVSGWFSGGPTIFSSMWDFQQQAVIDYVVNKIITHVKRYESATLPFTFAGYQFDVPDLSGDFFYWDSTANRQRRANLTTWTGSDSGANHIGLNGTTVKDYTTYADGLAAFYKQLMARTRQIWPNAKWVIDPARIYDASYSYDEYVARVSQRADRNELTADMTCEEGASTQFVDNANNFNSGMVITKDSVCNHQRSAVEESQNRLIAAKAGINGAWYNSLWGNLGGQGTMPNFQTITEVYPRLKLITVIPNWDNLQNIPLSQRTWNNSTTDPIYSSKKNTTDPNPTSYFDSHVMYSRQWKNNKLFVVFNDNTIPVKLNPNETISSIQCVDGYFIESGDCTSDFTVTDTATGKQLKLNSNIVIPVDSTNGQVKGVGYIITTTSGSSSSQSSVPSSSSSSAQSSSSSISQSSSSSSQSSTPTYSSSSAPSGGGGGGGGGNTSKSSSSSQSSSASSSSSSKEEKKNENNTNIPSSSSSSWQNSSSSHSSSGTQTSSLSSSSQPTGSTSSPQAPTKTITQSLFLGLRSNQVQILQEMLSSDKSIYPEGLTTGYYGKLTQAAVTRFQKKHNLETTGAVDLKTQDKLNEIYRKNQQTSSSAKTTSSLNETQRQERIKQLQELLKKLLQQLVEMLKEKAGW